MVSINTVSTIAIVGLVSFGAYQLYKKFKGSNSFSGADYNDVRYTPVNNTPNYGGIPLPKLNSNLTGLTDPTNFQLPSFIPLARADDIIKRPPRINILKAPPSPVTQAYYKKSTGSFRIKPAYTAPKYPAGAPTKANAAKLSVSSFHVGGALGY